MNHIINQLAANVYSYCNQIQWAMCKLHEVEVELLIACLEDEILYLN